MAYHKIGNAERRRRGTFKATQPTFEVTPPSEPHPELRRAPPGLTPSHRRRWRRIVVSATWLKPADIEALVLWVKATDAIAQAPDLKSVSREVAIATSLARQLGLTPAGRRQLGIAEPAPAEEKKAADPWGKLTVVA